jgi:hypothetical protein
MIWLSLSTGPEGSGEAFNTLESRFPSLKGRKFYATFQYSNGPYRACTAIEEGDDPAALGFETRVIPGGRYARRKLENRTEPPWDIPNVFAALCGEYTECIDQRRPSIEFYKSQKELILLLPVT